MEHMNHMIRLGNNNGIFAGKTVNPMLTAQSPSKLAGENSPQFLKLRRI